MKKKDILLKKLKQIDNKGYKQYKEIQGDYDFGDFTLSIDYVQGDPFASPSRLRARMAMALVKIPSIYFDTDFKTIALEDFLTRSFRNEINRISKGRRGSGKSGLIGIDAGEQEMIKRTSVHANENYVEARFVMGLPAKGRRILGLQAIQMIFDDLPEIINNSLKYSNIDKTLLVDFINTIEDQTFLRREMEKRSLIAFVANGAILPRESGISDKPMKGKQVVSFQGPKSLEVEFNLPNRGNIRGMGVPKGVTLIVGGGYHGKSTLLRGIERGVYNHIPGDGREFVLTIDDAVKIRAEDGRKVEKVNISPFISNLPFDVSTSQFTTENASGSTSQAANIMEALEIGTKLLLLDEDTSATNFMIRDGRMQALVTKDKEPITPFIDRVKQLYEEKDVSTILVIGGSGDYFDVADHVIMMENYQPVDVTDKAKDISHEYLSTRKNEGKNKFNDVSHRIPLKNSFELWGKAKIKTKGCHKILYGKSPIDLSYVEQLVDTSQTEAISNILRYLYQNELDNKRCLNEIIEAIMKTITEGGLETLSPYTGRPPGDLALPRPYEIGAAINRLRMMKMK